MRRRLPAGRRGFSLAELMVALVLSTVVIAALYNMFITASYVFLTQSQTSLAQLNLRYAIEQVKDDLRRAGLYATPNSDRDASVCPRPDPAVYGIVHLDASEVEVLPHWSTTNRFVRPDRLFLVGNFSSASSYPAKVFGQVVELQLPPWTRDPGMQPSVYTEAGFEHLFSTEQFVRITNAYGSSQLSAIQAIVADKRQVVLPQPPRLATSGTCGVTGTGDGLEVNPVNAVEYHIAATGLGNDSSRTDLVRTLVRMDAGRTRVQDADLVVGEYIVDFQVWFNFQDDNGAIPADSEPRDDVGNMELFSVDGQPGARPEMIRTAVIRVCARTEDEDESWMHRPRESEQDPLLSFDLDGRGDNGSTRVACLSSEVELVNLTLAAGPNG